MISFKEIEIAVNSTRMNMFAYLIQQVSMSADKAIHFSAKNPTYLDGAYDEFGYYETPRLMTLKLVDGQLSVEVFCYGCEQDWSMKDFGTNDLFNVCNAVHNITNDEVPNIGIEEPGVIDLPETDYKVID